MKVRLPGLLLLAVCGVSACVLHRLAVTPSGHQPATLDLLVGLLAVVCGSMGAAMTVVGPALFAPVPMPVRHRVRWTDHEW